MSSLNGFGVSLISLTLPSINSLGDPCQNQEKRLLITAIVYHRAGTRIRVCSSRQPRAPERRAAPRPRRA